MVKLMTSLVEKRLAKLAAKRTKLKTRMGVKTQTSAEENRLKIAELDNKWAVPDDAEDVKADKPSVLPTHLLFERRPKRRVYLAGKRREELVKLIVELPDTDTDLHIVAAGRGKRIEHGDIVRSFGFGNFIDYVTDEFGLGCVVHMATWSMNRDHALMLLELIDSGRIAVMNLLCDPAFTMRKNDIMTMLKTNLGRFDGCRYKTAKNHSKITCIRDRAGGRFCTISGSANLSGTPRAENYTLSTDPALYQHYVNNFFDVIFQDDRGGVW